MTLKTPVNIYRKKPLAVLMLSAHLLAADSMTIKVTPVSSACTIVHLPRWKQPLMPGSTGRWGEAMSCDFDFRSLDGGVLVGGYCQRFHNSPKIYSPSKYALSLGTGRIRNASDGEWDHADPYLTFRVTANSSGRDLRPDQKLNYDGKYFPKTGSKWPVADALSRVSPDGTYLAVNSWDGDFFTRGLLEPGRSYTEGHYYVDLYELRSARRVLALQGEFHGVDPDNIFHHSAWISKHHYILPLDWQNWQGLRHFALCDMQRIQDAADTR